ncbi:MAG: isoprenoid biosynthesis glyoxalase ElbB [Bacteroidia bacterium]|nr:isoprenoid biosynthesis glyoxalase ElbB [Bacteroidia bacterium]
MPTKRFAVILAGAGKLDGNDLHEAVLLLAAVARHGATYQCFAPDIEQHEVVDHLTGNPMPERRSVLRESARIARGDVKPLSAFRANDFDGLLMPGGYGVAKNLCTYAFAGENCTVNAEVAAAIKEMHAQGKPIGAMCIAPIVLAKVLGHGTITLGQPSETSRDAEKMGMTLQSSGHGQVVVDKVNHLYTTPCYMLDSTIADIWDGADALITAIMA